MAPLWHRRSCRQLGLKPGADGREGRRGPKSILSVDNTSLGAGQRYIWKTENVSNSSLRLVYRYKPISVDGGEGVLTSPINFLTQFCPRQNITGDHWTVPHGKTVTHYRVTPVSVDGATAHPSLSITVFSLTFSRKPSAGGVRLGVFLPLLLRGVGAVP